MIARYSVFRERLLQDWADVRRVALKAIEVFDAIAEDQPQRSVFIESAALNLHGFYSSLERIFEWLARQLDETVPTGPSWHRDLLRQMSIAISGVRPALLSTQTRTELEDYRGFRHVVRSAYTWEFDADKLGKLITRLPGLLQRLEDDLAQFGHFLDRAGNADTAP